jgi:undecaprenyl-diphosphatase
MALPLPRERWRSAWARLDTDACLRANAFCINRLVRGAFAAVSRLGDGVFWYVLMAALLLEGRGGAQAAAHLALTGVLALSLYRAMKHRLRRPRPFAADARIRPWVAPLDKFSFPSGHTLHAVAFTTVALAHFPALGWVLVPFTAAVAASRVVLGLHYPSDVLAATAIGLVLGGASVATFAAMP